METASEISRDALEAVKSGLSKVASVPGEVVRSAVRRAEQKKQGSST